MKDFMIAPFAPNVDGAFPSIRRQGTSRLAGLVLTMVTACLLTIGASQAMADDSPRLSVEFIVFERTGNIGHEEERWPEQPGMPALSDAIETGSSEARDLNIRASNSGKRLSGAAERIDRERNYRVLRHERWTLPEMSRDDSPLIRVHRDERPEPDSDASRPERRRVFGDAHLMDRPDSDTEADAPAVQAAQPLDGTLSIYRTRYFHVAADLLFNPVLDDDSLTPEEQTAERSRRLEALLAGQISFDEFQADMEREPFPGYRLTESRRLRLGELHYLDHPRFGVIIRLDRSED